MWYSEFAQGKTLSRGFFDEYSFKQLRQEMCGQWQKCYGEASIYLLFELLSFAYTKLVLYIVCPKYVAVYSKGSVLQCVFMYYYIIDVD